MDDHPIANDLDHELFSELVEPLVQPLLVHMVAPFVNGDDKNFSLQIGYTLEESAFNRIANLLNTRRTKWEKEKKKER